MKLKKLEKEQSFIIEGHNKDMIKNFIILYLLIQVFACSPYIGSRTTTKPLELENNLIYLDNALLSQIPCENLSYKKLSNGHLKINAKFFNMINSTTVCQIKIKFKDEHDNIIEETSWMPLTLPRKEITNFQHLSLNTDAINFTLFLRKFR